MMEDYRSALRAGQRAYRASVARGQSPYLAVLDDLLEELKITKRQRIREIMKRPEQETLIQSS